MNFESTPNQNKVQLDEKNNVEKEKNTPEKTVEYPFPSPTQIKGRIRVRPDMMEMNLSSDSIVSQQTPLISSSESFTDPELENADQTKNKKKKNSTANQGKRQMYSDKDINNGHNFKNLPSTNKNEEKEKPDEDKKKEETKVKESETEEMDFKVLARRRRKKQNLTSNSLSSDTQKKEKEEIQQLNRELAKKNNELYPPPLRELEDFGKTSEILDRRSSQKVQSYDPFKKGLIKNEPNNVKNVRIQNKNDFIIQKPQELFKKNLKKPKIPNMPMFMKNGLNEIKNENNFFENLGRRDFNSFQNPNYPNPSIQEHINWFQVHANLNNQILKSMILQNQLLIQQVQNFFQLRGPRNHMQANWNGQTYSQYSPINFSFLQKNIMPMEFGSGQNMNRQKNNFHPTFPIEYEMSLSKSVKQQKNIKVNSNGQQRLFSINKKSKDKFGKLEKLLKKIFLMENIVEEDLDLDLLERWIFEKVIEKKKYFLICGVVWTDVQFFDELKASTTPKRNEEKLKYVFKMTQKKMKKKFFQNHYNYCNECEDPKIKERLKADKEYAFFHYYFGNYCSSNKVSLEKIIQASGYDKKESEQIRKKNTKAIKSVNRDYLRLIKGNIKFMNEFKKYILFESEDITREEDTHNSIIGDSYATIQKKIENKIIEWTTMWYNSDKRSDEFKLVIEGDFNKKKYKLPWTMVDVYSAVDEVRQIIREESEGYKEEKFE